MADNFQPTSLSLPPPPADASGERGTSMLGLGALFGLLYFVQGIVEPTDGLLSQPIKSLLRNWGYSAASTAWFISVLSIAWAIKPLYGLLTDFVPLAGSRRRSYLLLTTAVASISLTAVYFLPLTSERVVLLLLLLLPSAVAIAFSDVVIDAMMIAAGQPRGMTGRLQSIQWTSMYAATIATGVAGGALSQWGMQQAGFLVAGLSCGISLLAVWFLVRERRQPDACAEASSVKRIPPSRAIAEMWQTFREPGIVAIGAFLFLWNFNPFSSTVLYYYSTEALHFSEQFVGSLTSWHAVGLLDGERPLRRHLSDDPDALADPRLDRCRHPGHDRLLGISRRDERSAHQPCGRRRVCDWVANPARSGGQGVSPENGGNDVRACSCRSPISAPRFRRVSADRSTKRWPSGGVRTGLPDAGRGGGDCSPRAAGS